MQELGTHFKIQKASIREKKKEKKNVLYNLYIQDLSLTWKYFFFLF